MAMNPTTLRNLTMASAKHLVTHGHISKAHHAKIMKSVAAPAMAANKPPAMPKPMGKIAAPAMSQQQLEQPVPMGALDAAPQPPGGMSGMPDYE